MIFNGTLIVQIGNFLLTYWFLDTFFLKKGYSVVVAENNELEELQNRIAMYKKLAHDAVQKKEQAWHVYSAHLSAEKPSLIEYRHKNMHIAEAVIDDIPLPTQKTISQLAARLVEKVMHD